MLITIAEALGKAFQLYSLLLLIWVILSWVPQIDRRHPVVQVINNIVEPTVAPFRRLMPGMGGIDLSPLIAYFVYSLMVRLIIQLLFKLSG